MTAQQLDAVKRLAERFGSNLSSTDVLHDPFGLPEGWISVVVHRKGTEPGGDDPLNNANILLCAGKVRRYSSVGCYPIFYVTTDNGCLCPRCVNDNFDQCCDPDDDQWYVTTHAANWENTDRTCDHCSLPIESAYGEEAA